MNNILNFISYNQHKLFYIFFLEIVTIKIAFVTKKFFDNLNVVITIKFPFYFRNICYKNSYLQNIILETYKQSGSGLAHFHLQRDYHSYTKSESTQKRSKSKAFTF